MRVAIGSDHAGFELKEAVKAFLANNGPVVDVGTYNADPVDYPDCAEAVAAALREDIADRGIIVCGSGVGASIAANRIPGIRAGLCHDTYSAHQGVEHDDMNVLVLGGRVIGAALARELIEAFLSARFTGEERHVRRLAKVAAIGNPLRALAHFGQSVWLDYIRHSLITSGELRRLIDEDGIGGVTSNPAIFEKAIAGSSDYAETLRAPEHRKLDAKAMFETLAIRDVREAADVLHHVYEASSRRDGYVSLEVSPHLAFDFEGTLQEGRRLWQALARPNVMIKVPATPQGIAAIHVLISEGINVNATLVFGLDAYAEVADAYLSGLESRASRGDDLKSVTAVASVFISRIDSAVDALIDTQLETANARAQHVLRSLKGKAAIANARLIYQRYQEIFSGPRWQALAALGATTQRLVWASTGTKNPQYRDVVYVEELIGADTVNTMPPATLQAFREHGRPRASLAEDVEAAWDTMSTLAQAGVSMSQITHALVDEGVRLFTDAFDRLLVTVDRQRQQSGAGRINRLQYALPQPLTTAVKQCQTEWQATAKIRRLWARDARLWTGRDEAQWLGWLGITNGQLAHVQRLRYVSQVARHSGFRHVLLLGMGGSSLGPEVLKKTFGPMEGFPELLVLDSTDPAQVNAFEHKVDLEHTLFIVSSKSGSTLEPNILKQYFLDRVTRLLGAEEAGRRFIAITDPGSRMQEVAESDGFRRVLFGWPDIGGRYSVLSDFGLIPAAVMGIDVPTLLDRAEEMVCACGPTVPIEENPGAMLGIILGVAAQQFGRNKVTLVASPGISSLGAWLEQLLAESTGKDGHGLIPIDGETIGAPDVYGGDRIFVYMKLLSAPDAEQDRAIQALEHAGHPVVRISLDEPYDLGEEFFRWEFATAVAGSILGVHPFDQPDVEASKTATRRLTAEFEHTGARPTETPIFADERVELYTDETNAAALRSAGRDYTLESYLSAHLRRLGEGDYFALLAYVEMNEAHERVLQALRHSVRDARHVATCLEFGPRFLHSTGQAYKGGPNTGVFLQITCDDAIDLAVPGQRFTFGAVKAAQERGDFQVLLERGRRALRVHLGTDVASGLARLHAAVRVALDH